MTLRAFLSTNYVLPINFGDTWQSKFDGTPSRFDGTEQPPLPLWVRGSAYLLESNA
jgi:hypothetical protein